MKVIITERQRKLLSEDEDREFLVKKKIAKKQLVKRFGDLIPYETDKHPNSIFYIDDGKNIRFEYNNLAGDMSDFNNLVDYDTIWLFLEETFLFDNIQIKQVIKEWWKEHYNLDVTRNSIIAVWSFMSWGDIIIK
jgi:hypothetical protein